MEQLQLADAAGVSVNTVRNMEASGADPVRGRVDTLSKLKAALEAAGIEFIPENGGGAGVRLKKKGL